ncbi:DUF21 domain-containing protein At4g14240-like isoform X2 [Gigantopelta aegis]|nr:DUF21 domain-containing protein At4g14240-like isoform X2 [Gigantopelta aegis]
MSGLTMGLLSLDLMTLNILKDGGTPKQKKHACRILPIVKRHHLLLVTLLLGNAAAVEAMPIFLDRISDPVIAIVVSISAVLFFGEVIPQALCTRFGLAIGATLSPLVYLLMGLFFVIAWPISKLLDCLLGQDHATFFRRAELKVLVDLHGPSRGSDSHNTDHLSVDEVLIIKGALDMKFKTALDAMLPIKDVFMLSADSKLDHDTMSSILSHGHSRIPVYDGSMQNIVALLLMKTLIKLNPDDAVSVTSLLEDSRYAKKVLFTESSTPLFDLLNVFQTGKGHLAVVKRSEVERSLPVADSGSQGDTTPLLGDFQQEVSVTAGSGHVLGIITLEDVIEELLQEEIVDETDVFRDIQKRIQVARAKVARTGNKSAYQRSQSDPSSSRQQRLSSDDPLITDVAIASPHSQSTDKLLNQEVFT